MKGQNVLRNTAALTLSGIIAKTIDFVFRAYYSRCLGSEGMGIFSLVFSVHGIMLTVATGGLGVAVSKIVSEQFASNRVGDIKKTMRIALGSVFVLSLAVICLTVLFSEQIAVSFLKEKRCQMSIVCLSPSILFMGTSYCIKGYFYASRNIFPPASSEFLEQAVKIFVIKALLDKMLPLGITHGCEAVFLGLSVGEFSSCLYLFVMYAFDRRKLCGTFRATKITQSILRISLPVMATSITGSVLRMQEEVLVVSALRSFGLSQDAALAQYGNIHGMVMPFIVFPLTLLSSCFTLLVPEISRAKAMSSSTHLKTLISRIYRFTAFFGFLVATMFFVFSKQLAHLFYGVSDIAQYLKILCLLAPFMFMDSVSCGILNGLGKQGSLFIYGISDSLIRIFLIIFLIPRYGITALIGIIAFSNLFTFISTVQTVLNETKLRFEISGWLLKHLLTASISVFVASSLFSGFAVSVTETVLLTAILFTSAVYIVAGIAFDSTSRSDFLWLTHRMFSGS